MYNFEREIRLLTKGFSNQYWNDAHRSTIKPLHNYDYYNYCGLIGLLIIHYHLSDIIILSFCTNLKLAQTLMKNMYHFGVNIIIITNK